jgi:hypothetical protein
MLPAFCIDVLQGKPAQIPSLQGWSLMVDHREPRAIAILALDHHMLAEHTSRLEAEAQGCALRRFVAVVALPLVAPIARSVEYVLREQTCASVASQVPAMPGPQ